MSLASGPPRSSVSGDHRGANLCPSTWPLSPSLTRISFTRSSLSAAILANMLDSPGSHPRPIIAVRPAFLNSASFFSWFHAGVSLMTRPGFVVSRGDVPGHVRVAGPCPQAGVHYAKVEPRYDSVQDEVDALEGLRHVVDVRSVDPLDGHLVVGDLLLGPLRTSPGSHPRE